MTPKRKATVVNQLTALCLLQGFFLAYATIVGGVPHTRWQIFAAVVSYCLLAWNVIHVWRIIDRT